MRNINYLKAKRKFNTFKKEWTRYTSYHRYGFYL